MPPTLSEPRLGYWLVEDEQGLAAALAEISRASELTVDAERASGFRYRNSAYLVQIGKENAANFIFDPVALRDSADWNIRLASELNQKRWVLHAATQDLPCLSELGLMPNELFDTELAARLCGIKRFGLASLAEELLGYRIAKEHSAADWSLRPLSSNMLNYAAIDVEVLFGIRVALTERLSQLNREDWAEQEFRHLRGFRPREPASNGWRRMSGAGSLRLQLQQQIAASLWQVRDSRARERDVAPGRLLPDSAVIAAATQMPKSIAELSAIRAFSGRESRSQVQTWWRAIQEAPEFVLEPVPAQEIPPHRIWERKYPEAWQRYLSFKAALQPLLAQLEIPAENLISPGIIREIAWQPRDITAQLQQSGARNWQIELIARLLSDALQHSS